MTTNTTTKKVRPARLIVRSPESEYTRSPRAYALVDRPAYLEDYWRRHVATQPDHEPQRESFVAVLVNTRLRAFAHTIVSIGTLNETVAHPRDILRAAIVGGAYAIAAMHNHPSGDPSPSRADREITARIAQACSIMQIDLLDHVIIGERHQPGVEPYFSFREAGLL